jgi:hypothetical protein
MIIGPATGFFDLAFAGEIADDRGIPGLRTKG